MDRNRRALDAVLLLPGVLKGEIAPKVETRFLGRDWSVPFGISPVGATGMMWPGIEKALARHAARAGLPYTLSIVATRTPEEIGPLAAGNGWFQLYALGDREKQRDLVRRAKAAGFSALVLTVDVPVSSRRERQRRAGFTMPPRITPEMLWQTALHPAWAMGVLRHGMPRFRTLARYIPQQNLADVTRRIASDMHPPLGWDVIGRLREDWQGPLILKGILRAQDAVRAKAEGVDAVWVSNHGGRQIDAAPPSILCLPEIRDAVGPDYPLLFDSGVRSGLDIARALALGADFVMLGRAWVYGGGALGEAGPDHVHAILKEDLLNAMNQIGARTTADLGKAIFSANFRLQG